MFHTRFSENISPKKGEVDVEGWGGEGVERESVAGSDVLCPCWVQCKSNPSTPPDLGNILRDSRECRMETWWMELLLDLWSSAPRWISVRVDGAGPLDLCWSRTGFRGARPGKRIQ